ncbi:signal recognition particle 54 kDa protein-like [Pecten maximus]|uniref:signal recognition particle 54 kDa protein-like n=1 Tax=Pecten maximus TaxID=6579 RepID=UPI001458E03A|nr:signal recognition particle 54 kDa protein-like [Pecten maximus]
MNAGKLLIYLIFIMLIVWYTAIWSLVFKVRADTALSDFTVKTITNSGECLRKTKVDDRLLVRYVIKIHGTDNVIESRTNEDSPFVVHLGQFVDIPTLERGLYDMCEEESRSMVVPPLLGYGTKDSQTKNGNLVPGNSTLQYEVTLVKIFSKETNPTQNTAENFKRNEGIEEKEEKAASSEDDKTREEGSNPKEGTEPNKADASKEKDRLILTNMMGDAMKAVITSKEGKGIAGMAKKMIGGIFGGGGGGSKGSGIAGLVNQLAGAMGSGGSGGGGEGMAGLMGKLAGAMGGGGGMDGMMEQLAAAMGNQGEGGMDGLLGKLGEMMGQGDGNKDGLAAIMSQLGGEGGGLMGMMGQLGGSNGGKMAEALAKMMKNQKEKMKRRKTEL